MNEALIKKLKTIKNLTILNNSKRFISIKFNYTDRSKVLDIIKNLPISIHTQDNITTGTIIISPIQVLKRSQALADLIANELDTVEQMLNDNDTTYIHDLFFSGFKGYSNFTNKQLATEYEAQFESKIKIIKD